MRKPIVTMALLGGLVTGMSMPAMAGDMMDSGAMHKDGAMMKKDDGMMHKDGAMSHGSMK